MANFPSKPELSGSSVISFLQLFSKRIFGEVEQVLDMLDTLPVTQPTVSNHLLTHNAQSSTSCYYKIRSQNEKRLA